GRLLERVGVVRGRGPAFFAWLKFSGGARSLLDRPLEGLGALEDAALALRTSTSGADLLAVGRCPTREAAAATSTALEASLKDVAKHPNVAMLGLRSLVEGVKVEILEGTMVHVSLHMTRDQYLDVVTRLAGLATIALQNLRQQVPLETPQLSPLE